MKPLHQVVAQVGTSSLPPVWVIRDLLQVEDKVRTESEGKSPLTVLDLTIRALLVSNPTLPPEHLHQCAAIMVWRLGLYENCKAYECILRYNDPQDQKVESKLGHRYLVMGQEIIDPFFDILTERRYEPSRHSVFRVSMIPSQYISHMVNRADLHRYEDERREISGLPARYARVCWHIARSLNLPPNWWASKDHRTVAQRIDFEGILRKYVYDDLVDEDPDWGNNIVRAIRSLWPAWPEESVRFLVKRIRRPFGPSVPKGYQLTPIEKINVKYPNFQQQGIPLFLENNGAIGFGAGLHIPGVSNNVYY